jgi:hypothetical protein
MKNISDKSRYQTVWPTVKNNYLYEKVVLLFIGHY